MVSIVLCTVSIERLLQLHLAHSRVKPTWNDPYTPKHRLPSSEVRSNRNRAIGTAHSTNMIESRLAQLRSMLESEPNDSFLRYAIALELKRMGNIAEAVSGLSSLLQDQPTHIPSYYQLATFLGEVGRTNDAIEVCRAGALQCIVAGDRKARAELMGLMETLEESAP